MNNDQASDSHQNTIELNRQSKPTGRNDLLGTLRELEQGGLSVEEAFARLNHRASQVVTESGTIDTGREIRCGIPEVIYCESKSASQIVEIAGILLEHHGLAFGTRCSSEKAEQVLSAFPDADYNQLARTIRVGSQRSTMTHITTTVIAAGTSDFPVAEEAFVMLETFGAPVVRINDVGVAGLHRIEACREQIERSGIVIVVAGMEGALPSVVGGLTAKPVIAVPTSIGYGTAFGGITPLFAMLTSCSFGITVVNIDNGFGAAAAALRMIALQNESHERER